MHWPRIVGHERPLEILDAALASGRFHHAWIFSGPRGIGKFTTAFEIARRLLTHGPRPPHTPRAPRAPSMMEGTAAGSGGGGASGGSAGSEERIGGLIEAGTHPDLHIIRKEMALYSDDRQLRDRKLMTIPVGVLRELMLGGKSGDTTHEAAAYRTAAMGVGKVFIIDEAELLAGEAQNAMLKTLEEPPANTWIFLITSLPNRLLPTIHSRCQHLRFGRLSDAAMAEWWREHQQRQAEREDGETNSRTSRKKDEAFDAASVPASTVRWALAWAEGSPGMALMAMEYGFHQWHQTLEPMLREIDRGVFPASMGETLGGFVEQFAQAWVKRHGERETSKDAANKDGSRHVLSMLGSHARSKLAERADDGDASERWALAIDLLRECERQIDSNVNQKLAMDNLVAQWTMSLAGEIAV